jgi:CRISPR/Cas system endoribonuclease Cas6 (RAMP superfamily)
VLRTQSESPLLKKYNIVLRSLQDYFHYVVVGSRQNVRLDEIKALDENRVRAYMYINESPVIIYELQRTDGRWKIGIIE